MILHALSQPGQPGYPWLVFLHGFSGDHREWLPIGQQLAAYPRLYVDLPGHGGSSNIATQGFDEFSQQLTQTLAAWAISEYGLIGYSLGGRLAWYFASQQPVGLCGLVVEGAHPGLQELAQRQLRRQNDARWAARFRHQPLSEVFTDWYQQPVFASLTPAQRQALVDLRRHNQGHTLAAMLEATSLAAQPDLRATAESFPFPFYYLCGENDDKFRALAAETTATIQLIDNAGHNAHRDNPAMVAGCLAQFFVNLTSRIPYENR
ncbi:2-succinyl-6-hydroxy-2,4-cyclohexadiene-1-carboxylate synthase [Enterobacteriaceae bacterium ESL0689]|nr:2-succinyl-6-hydroxy-2,4-cyclohexadiene-1-carboxylate synthase [Enterobacteriaceae bacterium ESL0689]